MLQAVPSAKTVDELPNRPISTNLTRKVGRPAKGRLAFSRPARYQNRTGPPSRLELMTETELSEILALCGRGTDPMTAVIKIVGVSATTFKNWRDESERDGGDERYRIFFSQLGQAFASCRSNASIRVTEDDPLAALTRGPLGRSRPGYPGWTETHEVRHTDHTGEGPPVLRVRLQVGRLGITSEVVRDDAPRLESGDDSDD